LGGVIVVALAVFALADPQFTVQTFAIVIAAGLVIGGLFRIAVGAFATMLPSSLRGFNVTGGVIAFVLGIVALLDLQAVVATLIGILAVALLLVGALEIGVGVARHPPIWLRLVIVAIGVLTIVLSVAVIRHVNRARYYCSAPCFCSVAYWYQKHRSWNYRASSHLQIS
jgi:uncharacterized membrane protein HdeD (DUF308 family)